MKGDKMMSLFLFYSYNNLGLNIQDEEEFRRTVTEILPPLTKVTFGCYLLY